MKRFNEHYAESIKRIGEDGSRTPAVISEGELHCIKSMLYDLADEVELLKDTDGDYCEGCETIRDDVTYEVAGGEYICLSCYSGKADAPNDEPLIKS